MSSPDRNPNERLDGSTTLTSRPSPTEPVAVSPSTRRVIKLGREGSLRRRHIRAASAISNTPITILPTDMAGRG